MAEQTVGPPVDGVSEVEVDGRISVYSPRTQQLVALNETASDVWRLCDGELTVEAIVARLADAYDVPPEAIAEDVRAALSDFAEQGLLPPPREAAG